MKTRSCKTSYSLAHRDDSERFGCFVNVKQINIILLLYDYEVWTTVKLFSFYQFSNLVKNGTARLSFEYLCFDFVKIAAIFMDF